MGAKVDIIAGISILAICGYQYYFLRKILEIEERQCLAHLFRKCAKCNKQFCIEYVINCENCVNK